jgi:phosphatidylglycerophosphatase A|tara:strand:- start:811 stop:1278 length:468 start_codon:yes stop_codon:yes gene_type:complete
MKLNQKFLRTVTTLFFSGYSPIAPGTAGTAVVALLYVIFSSWIESMGFLAWLFVLITTSAVAIYTSDLMSREWGKDPGRIVIDEGVGFLFTVAFLPVGIATAVAGFFVFRALDIFKPPPARQIEALSGGWGIVADDIVAGIYSNIILRIIFYVMS